MVKSPVTDSELSQSPAPATNPLAAQMLTPSEVESLRQDKKDLDDFAKKAFSHLRPTK